MSTAELRDEVTQGEVTGHDVSGPDGNLWFTIPGDAGFPAGRTPYPHGELGRITTTGSIDYFLAPTAASSPYGLTVGSDGALWFTEARHPDFTPAKIGRMTTGGEASEYWDTGDPQVPRGIAKGPDGNLWFGDAALASPTGRLGVGRLVPALGPCSPTPTPTQGQLRVTTSPALPSQILVNGIPTDSWGLNWMDMRPDIYSVAFTHVPGYTEPAPQTVNVTAGAITTVAGNFTQRGSLRVITSPAVPAAISVDGSPRDDWGMWTDLPVGSHQVCFGPTANFTPPACQTVSVTAGNLTQVTGNYTSSPGAPGPTGTGQLRVTTSPALPSQILLNGVPMDSWGLNWVDLAPGSYTLSFTHVEGYTEPSPQTVVVTAGATTVVQGSFTQRGSLRVITSPAEPANITVDGLPRNNWGMWTDVPVGSHTVCFGLVPSTLAPPCQTVTVNAGALTTVTGTYTPGPQAPTGRAHRSLP